MSDSLKAEASVKASGPLRKRIKVELNDSVKEEPTSSYGILPVVPVLNPVSNPLSNSVANETGMVKIICCNGTRKSIVRSNHNKIQTSLWKKRRIVPKGKFAISILIFLSCLLIYLLDTKFQSYGLQDTNLKIIYRKEIEDEKKIFERNINYSSETSFCIVMNTFNRPLPLIKETVSHYAHKCGKSHGISHIYIIWSKDELPSVSYFLQKSASPLTPDIKIIRAFNSSLNSRFYPIRELSVEAIFSVDDDIEVDCKSLKHGFDAWKANKRSMVGYYPRLHRKKNSQKYVYHSWLNVFFRNEFSMVMTKASFLHKQYFDLYWDNSKTQILVRKYVDEKRNCEDIAMALLVAARSFTNNIIKDINTTSNIHHLAFPVFVEGKVVDKGLINGISATAVIPMRQKQPSKSHFSSRCDCITEFFQIYKGNENFNIEEVLPSIKLTDRSWKRHFPGYWWQQRPSNLAEWFPSSDLFYSF